MSLRIGVVVADHDRATQVAGGVNAAESLRTGPRTQVPLSTTPDLYGG